MSAAANGVAGKRDSVLSRTPSSTMPSSVAGSNTTSIKGATVGLGTGSTMGKGTVGLGIGLGRSTNGTSSADDAASRNRRKSAANVSTIQLSTATLGSFKPMDGSLLGKKTSQSRNALLMLYPESKMKQSQLPQQNPKPDPFEDEFPSLAAGTSQYTKGNRAMKESSKGDSVSAVAPAESRSVDWAAKVTASSSAEARQAAAAERRSDSITQFSDKEELERLRILVPKIQVSSKQGSNKLPRKTNKTISTINPPKPATSNPRLSTSIASNTTSRASSMSIKMSSSPPIAALGAKPQVASMPVHTSLSGLLRPLQRTGKQLGKEKKNDARKSSEEVAEPTLTSPVKQKAEDETKSGRSDSDSSLMVSDGIAKDRKPAIKSAGSDDDSLVSAFENVKIGETPNDKSWPFETDSPFSKAPTPIVRLAESKPPPESWEDEVASPLLTTSSIGTVAPLQKEVPKSPPSAELDIVEDVPSQLEINSARNGLKNDFSDRQPLLPVREEEIPSKSGDSGTEGMGRYSEPHQLLSAGSSQPTLDFSTFQYLSGISPVEDNSHPPYSHPNAFKGRSLSEAFTSKLPPSNQYQRHSVDHYPMDTSYYSEANPAYPDPAPSFVPSVMLETHDILNQRMRTMSSPAISFNKVHASQRSPSATTLGGFWTTEYKPQESMLPSLVSPGHFFPERLELLGRHGSVDERNGEYIMTEEEKSAFWRGVGRGLGGDDDEETDAMPILSFNAPRHRSIPDGAEGGYMHQSLYSDAPLHGGTAFTNNTTSMALPVGYSTGRPNDGMGHMGLLAMTQPPSQSSLYGSDISHSLNPNVAHNLRLLESEMMGHTPDAAAAYLSTHGSLATNSLASYYGSASNLNPHPVQHHHPHHLHRASIPPSGLYPSAIASMAGTSGMAPPPSNATYMGGDLTQSSSGMGFDPFSHARRSSISTLKTYPNGTNASLQLLQ